MENSQENGVISKLKVKLSEKLFHNVMSGTSHPVLTVDTNISTPSRVSYPWENVESGDKAQKNMEEERKDTSDGENSQPFSSSEPSHRERKRWVRPTISDTDRPSFMCEKLLHAPFDLNAGGDFPTPQAGSKDQEAIKDDNVPHNRNKDLSTFYEAMRRHVSDYTPTSELYTTPDTENGKALCEKEYFPPAQGSFTFKEGINKDAAEEQPQECVIGPEVIGGARILSPSSVSSVASGRRLEWDSGADVGYQAYSQTDHDGLSTIERIALAQGCSAALFARLDPEGRPEPLRPPSIGHCDQMKCSVKGPVAESTPLDACDIGRVIFKPTSVQGSLGEITPILRDYNQEVAAQSSSGDEYEEEVKQRVLLKYSKINRHMNENCSDDQISSERSFNLLIKKYSNSMSDLSVCDNQMENPGRSLPRSCSSLSLSDREKKKSRKSLASDGALTIGQPCVLAATCSLSSSSVATIVQKQDSPSSSTKLTQPVHIPMKSSVGVQTYENGGVNELPKVVYQPKDQCQGVQSKEHISPQSHKCTGAHRKGSACSESKNEAYVSPRNSTNIVHHIPEENSHLINDSKTARQENNKSSSPNFMLKHQGQEQDFGTLESVASSTQTAGSWFAADISHADPGVQTADVRRGSAGVVGSANSFEYLPGDMYESNAAAVLDSVEVCNPATEDSCSEASVNHVHSANDKSSPSNEVSSSSSLARDLEQGVQLLKELVAGKAHNAKLKKALIRRVIDRLIESDIGGDSPSPKPSLALDSNVPWTPAHPASVSDQKTSDVSKKEGQLRTDQAVPSTDPREMSDSHRKRKAVDKCVGTAPSEVTTLASSCTPSGSISLPAGDSRMETTTDASSRSASKVTDMSGQSPGDWKRMATQSEREFDYQRQKFAHLSAGHSALVDFCQTERENQLYWIQFEIDHLSNLKQLLKRKGGNKEKLVSLASHKHKFHTVKPTTSAGFGADIGSAEDCLKSRMCISSSTSETHQPETNSQSRNAPKDGAPGNQAMGQNSIISNEDYTNWCSHHYISSQMLRKNRSIQMPSSKCLKQQESRKNKCVREEEEKSIPCQRSETDKEFPSHSPTFESPGSIPRNADTVESSVGSILDGSGKNGRINVYSHIVKHMPVKEQMKNVEESREKVKKAEYFSLGSEDVLKGQGKSIPICCCECKQILKDIVQSAKQVRGSGSSGTYARICCKCHTSNKERDAKEKPDIPSIPKKSLSSSISHQASRTSDDVAEITNDTKDSVGDQRKSVAVETLENAAVQTTPSLNDLPIIRPSWYLAYLHTKEKEKKNGNQDKLCPCCGRIQPPLKEQSTSISLESPVSPQYCHCNTPRLQVNRACPCCMLLKSRAEHTNKTSAFDNAKKEERRKSACCPCCGRVESSTETNGSDNIIEKETFVQSDKSLLAPLPESAKEPLAYLLTFEPTHNENILARKMERTSLPEVKVKIPMQRQMSKESKSDDGMGMEVTSSNSGKSSTSSKENKKPQDSSESQQENNIQQKKVHKPTLQEYLKSNRPSYVECADKRRQCLSELAYLRELRHKRRQELLALTSEPKSQTVQDEPKPSMPSRMVPRVSERRTFTRQMMRSQTKKLYQKAAEVKSKKVEKKRKEDYRTNRLMAEIFTKKLQKKVLQGKVNISNSESIISSM